MKTKQKVEIETRRQAYNERLSAISKARNTVIARRAEKRLIKAIVRSACKAGVASLLGLGEVKVSFPKNEDPMFFGAPEIELGTPAVISG